jgi:DNA invertase Pin-like site-specific DNA recombinase
MTYFQPPPDLPPGSTVWLYLRDSGGPEQEQSTAQQRREIEGFCKQHGLIIADVFEDVSRSGTSTKGRAAFLDMIDRSNHPGRPVGLLVWNFARFARDMDDSAYYRFTLRRNGLVIHSLSDPIPPGDFSRVIESILDYSNQEKSRQTSRDVKRGLANRTLAGFAPGGPPPRGYKATFEEIGIKRNGQPRYGTRWTPDPDLAPLVTLAFKLRAEGKSLPEIMRATHGKLYPNKNCFCTFFSNKSYLGLGKCGDLEVENHHPALIDPETWQAVRDVQERIRRNMTGNLLHPKRLNSPSLLSGIAVCIHCGSPIVREVSGPRKWKAYLCGKKKNHANWHACEGRQIQSARADTAILDAVLTRILTPDFVTALLEDLKAQLSDTSDIDRQENTARQSLATCERSIARLLDTIEATESSTAKARLKERENERAALQFELTALQARKEAARLDISPDALDLILSVWTGAIRTAQEANDIRGLQSLLRQFVTKIELGYSLAKIWYTYPVSAFEPETKLDNKSSGPLVDGLGFIM